MVILSLGHLRWRTLLVATIVALLLFAGLGFHAGNREATLPTASTVFWWALPLVWGISAGLTLLFFIGISLLVAGDQDRRLIASYTTYHEVFWRHVKQFVVAAVFVGLFWGILWLGSALFNLIGIDVFFRTLVKPGFWIPATCVATAAALHLGDSRTGVLRALRSRAPDVLAWLLPVLVVITAGFLCTLLFTGLQPLWRTKIASSLLLTSALALVLLINVHFQDGGQDTNRTFVLRGSRMIAALLLGPLVVLAAGALSQRIGQYGLTPSRVVGAAIVVVIGCYALGYTIAALRSGPELRDLPATNIVASLVILAAVIALGSPLADPARLSVNDQVARLESGKVAPDKFDYAFLAKRSASYGTAALQRLKGRTDGPNARQIAEKAAQALNPASPSTPYTVSQPPKPATVETRIANIKPLRPDGDQVPAAFYEEDWNSLKNKPHMPSCLTNAEMRCEALLIDLTGDGKAEILLIHAGSQGTVFAQGADGKWAYAGYTGLVCSNIVKALRAGDFETVPTDFKDIEANGMRLHILTDTLCVPKKR
jgi:hypothetical protein